jgi:1-acyl-sn-glycerol-3-phosphate acyltransferase
MNEKPESLFLPATPRRWVIALCKWALGPLMRVYYRVKAVRISRFDHVTHGKRVVFVANHVDRRDAVVAFCISKRLGGNFYYMSNREQLDEGTLFTWLLRSCGVYSIARGMVDVSSIKYTLKLLTGENPHRLFLFPEGGAFSRNTSVFPFLTQPFDLILRAQKQIAERESVYIVPVAIRYEYDNPEKEIEQSIARLERAVGLNPDNRRSDLERLLTVGEKVVESFDHVFDVELPAYETAVHEKGLRIKKHLIESLKAQLALIGGEGPRKGVGETGELEEARDVLNQLYARHSSTRTDESLPKNHYERRLRRQIFDRMSRVFDEAKRLENWIGLDREYFRESVSTHRIIDAIIRLEREVFGEVLWSAERTAVVRLGDPIDAKTALDAEELAERSRATIQEMLAR